MLMKLVINIDKKTVIHDADHSGGAEARGMRRRVSDTPGPLIWPCSWKGG
jgi:hypothetical protein